VVGRSEELALAGKSGGVALHLDFTERAELDEAMDSLANYAEYRQCLRDLDAVSRIVLAHRPTEAFLDEVAKRHPGPLRVLDVACGDGSMLRRIERWAKRRGIAVKLTGVDLNAWAIRVAREFGESTTEYVVSDVFEYAPAVAPDVILSAHFTHHLPEVDLVRFLRWMEGTARLGWFVNDLHRHPNPYRLFAVLGRVMPWHPVIRADGLISIRRAFTVADWERMTLAAGIAGCVIAERFPARVTVSSIR
jgi:2-polyprenyl-3-methyl-5-hydroxy-6-metoxy-1,4-benzoquinol methylase